MKLTRFAAAAALALGVASPIALHADTSSGVAPLVHTHSTRTHQIDDFLNRLRGENPRFDYTMWLNPDLRIDESTVAHGLGTLERYRRMKEATVYIQNSKADPGSANSLGSGVILDNQNCWVISNDHVTEGADFLHVSYITGWLPDGTPLIEQVSATVVGHPGDKDQGFDLTLLQMDSCEGAAWAPILKDHTLVKDGEKSVAVGNPLGQTWTLTEGVISHTSRMMRGGPWPMIQTDASVNRGNSGGPLFDQNGEIIGINTLILSQSGDNNGIAMSIRSDLLRLFLNNMYRYGQMQVNRIGVAIGPISQAEARIMGIPGGVVVSEVFDGTPSAEAGIQEGDIITHVDGVLSTSQNRIIMSVWSAEPNVGAHARIMRPNDAGGYDLLVMTIPVRNVWESSYTPPASESYEGLLGWTLEENAEIGGLTVTGTAAMSPAHRLSMAPVTVSESKQKQRNIGGRDRIVTETVEGKRTFVITGVKAEGQPKLDLTQIVGVAPGARADALEAYIRGTNGKPVVLYITVVNEANVSVKSMTGRDVQLSAAELRGLFAEYGVANSNNDIVLYAQPKPYTAAPDLNTWTPPATGN